ncbi:hypothetical protein B0H14DRAFT_3444994 [Mycena olivaceomarginata]|nr:hypothetical protein B0H14DRAFT_3444994 [Mycena olivaceomarginata]
MPLATEEENDPDFLAARAAAVQRSLDMVREADAERQRVGWGDYWYDRARARDALSQYGRQRLPKICRANARRDARRLYISRMPEYELQRAALNWTPSPKWEVTDTEANWGEDTWGTGEWGPTDPAWQDPGFWLTPKGDDISPILLIRPLPSY